ncbi:dCMP deaminase family protein [Thalassobaculum litoreum]|uniref:dCMP deaminase n=1 Tax=Thalassobaculum litoreum DSM 18839 TaxID=1123362 RepID=A0A8G2BHY4_9PROT|nr:dCMP deaminase family protein [Thalassobaculum litoreum]SDF82525.1 dCMP deaminase [Thalassobaculum litoreum DSM 18839]
MAITKWDLRFMDVAQLIASWSKDSSTKVGAVIADPAHRIVSTGYNGLPRGLADDGARMTDRDVKLRLTLHAEHNAILFAQRDLLGCTIYVTAHPCAHCAAQIVQTGIARVVFASSGSYEERWAADIQLAAELFGDTGVGVERADRSGLAELQRLGQEFDARCEPDQHERCASANTER